MNKLVFTFLLALSFSANLVGQTTALPEIIHQNGRHQLFVDGKPFFILGGQVHNSSAWPGMLPQVWKAAAIMHLNTLEVPIYWEQIEPKPGNFEFYLIDTLLAQARAHNVRLALLWFATWKNGSNHYMPEWMKKDGARYPNVTGTNGAPADSPSPNADATLQADKKAFAVVMRYLKKVDAPHTVIMVQVENEPGAWGSVRDYSAAAQQLFNRPVPAPLLQPEVLSQLPHEAAEGSWEKVFGKNADEYFQAWSVASFIGQVAAAGKAEFALPMYVNAALRDPLLHPAANTYESGGATDNVLSIYKAAAPAIDVLAPDIYLSGNDKVLKVLDLYSRTDNPLFVPEAGLNLINAKYLYEVIARGGIGFSPFGIDDNGRGSPDTAILTKLQPFAQEYAGLTPMLRELAQWSFAGKIKSVVEDDDHGEQTIDLGTWQAIISFGGFGRGNTAPHNSQPIGKAMVIQLDENTFIAVGTLCHITFKPVGSGTAWQYLKVEEGRYQNGSFVRLRIQNGDETDWGGPRFGASPTVLKISLTKR